MHLGQLLLEAFNLLFVGMLFVGTFLGLLVFIIPFLNKIVPDDPVPAAKPAQNIPATDSNALEQETLVAVITAAVAQYRNRN